MTVDYKKDIYFDPRLGDINARVEGGVFHEYYYKDTAGIIRHQFVIRPVKIFEQSSDNIVMEKYYDIITPYGYGGPLILDVEPGRKGKLLRGFEKDFLVFVVKIGLSVNLYVFIQLLIMLQISFKFMTSNCSIERLERTWLSMKNPCKLSLQNRHVRVSANVFGWD